MVERWPEAVMVFPPGPLPRPRPLRWQPLGRRLAAAREAQGWTVLHMAAQVHVQGSTVQRWERGRHPPHRRVLRQVARVLDLPDDELAALAGYPVDAED
jgi:transcriptional regulator with XRE-family HTH domain